jgi:predicted amidophosphoribosyltransferase
MPFVVLLWVCSPFITAGLAWSRGANPVIWFTAGIVFGPIGVLVAMYELWNAQQDAGGETEAGSCPSCGGEIGPDAAFCSSCGASLALSCPSCGGEVTPDVAFCSSCGARLAS